MPNSFSVAVIKHKAVVAWRDCLGTVQKIYLEFLQISYLFTGGIDEYSCMEARA